MGGSFAVESVAGFVWNTHTMDMHMRPSFFLGEEKEPVSTFPVYRRTHLFPL
jgi:hypothetical protein